MTAHQINKWGLVLFALFTLAAPFILPLFIDAFWVDIYSEMLIWSLLAGRKAEGNPWGEGATTLEWTLSSPPPFHQFETLPVIDADARH